ncbi:MAG: hypothetical protein HY975_00305 [Candidatus Kerfeldbacteria bacterium]|nr:hypothetical protein [Candidatus Kerfeldbacteria bacterium]
MNLRLTTISVIALLVWFGVGVAVLDRLMVFRPSTTIAWPHPAKPNVSFSWSSPPTVVDGAVSLAPGEQRSVNVTVPRAFVSGRFEVATLMNSGGVLELRAPTRPGRPTATTTLHETFNGHLDVQWHDVAASVRTFAIQFHNTGASPITLQRVTFTLHR